jgi:outer membrane protein TolC
VLNVTNSKSEEFLCDRVRTRISTSSARSFSTRYSSQLALAASQRRPDIAAAERRVFAANAQIGEAHAAFFPDLALSASAGLESTFFAPWLTAPSLFWSIGPQLVGMLFDGGRRDASLQSANSQYDGSVADYRQTVLVAFQQVEDNLSALQSLQSEAASQQRATSAAGLALKLTTNRFQTGCGELSRCGDCTDHRVDEPAHRRPDRCAQAGCKRVVIEGAWR